jgi:hypothetical protein
MKTLIDEQSQETEIEDLKTRIFQLETQLAAKTDECDENHKAHGEAQRIIQRLIGRD